MWNRVSHQGGINSFTRVKQIGMVRGARQGGLGMRDREVVSERENLSAHLWSGVTGARFIV